MFPNSIFCFYLYYATDLGPNAFELSFLFWSICIRKVKLLLVASHCQMVLYYMVPFDCKTPIGYLIAVTSLYLVHTCIFLIAGVIVSLEIGALLLMMEFIQDIQNDIKSINKIVKLKKISLKC